MKRIGQTTGSTHKLMRKKKARQVSRQQTGQMRCSTHNLASKTQIERSANRTNGSTHILGSRGKKMGQQAVDRTVNLTFWQEGW